MTTVLFFKAIGTLTILPLLIAAWTHPSPTNSRVIDVCLALATIAAIWNDTVT